MNTLPHDQRAARTSPGKRAKLAFAALAVVFAASATAIGAPNAFADENGAVGRATCSEISVNNTTGEVNDSGFSVDLDSADGASAMPAIGTSGNLSFGVDCDIDRGSVASSSYYSLDLEIRSNGTSGCAAENLTIAAKEVNASLAAFSDMGYIQMVYSMNSGLNKCFKAAAVRISGDKVN